MFRVTERKYHEVIWIPYSSEYTLDINKQGEISLRLPENAIIPASEIYYTTTNINLKGSFFRIIGLIGIGVLASLIIGLMNMEALKNYLVTLFRM